MSASICGDEEDPSEDIGVVEPDDQRCSLYRHYDATGTLLYVGISLSWLVRLTQHRENAHWYRDIATVSTQWFGTREEARAAEAKAIAEENPKHNIQRPGTARVRAEPFAKPFANKALAAFEQLASKGDPRIVALWARHQAARDPAENWRAFLVKIICLGWLEQRGARALMQLVEKHFPRKGDDPAEQLMTAIKAAAAEVMRLPSAPQNQLTAELAK